MASTKCLSVVGLLLAVSISASAQSRSGSHGGRGSQPPAGAPGPPPHGGRGSSQPPPVIAGPALPSAPAAIAVPNPFAPAPGTLDLYHRPDNFQSLSPQQLPIFYPGQVFPSYGYGYGYGYASDFGAYPPMTGQPERSNAARMFATGGLRLETQPESAQVFVDGYYKGLVEDYGLRGKILDLNAGSHHVELRAAGYAPLSFEVSITPNETSRFRGDLELLARSQARSSMTTASAAVSRYYIIPNCYAGNRPPTGALPAGCDVKKMREVR
jgi:hypothetical protein